MEKENHVNRSRMEYQEIQAFESMVVEEMTFTALKANHKQGEECLIFAVQDETGSLLYANDTGQVPEETLDYIRRKRLCFDVVSMDSGRGTLPGDGHMGLNENIALRKKLQEMGAVHRHTRYFLNHFCHMCKLTPDEYQELVGPHGFTLTYDGMTVEL